MDGKSMLIGVKVGSSLLTDDKGVNREYLLNLCRQIAELKRSGHRVFLVTSGAVASEPYEGFDKNLRASIGQAKLIGEYRYFFGIFGIKAAQILVTDEDFSKSSKSVALRTIKEAFSLYYHWRNHWIIPIINANDVVSSEELKALSVCADNDRLSQLICERLSEGEDEDDEDKVDIMIIGMDEVGLKDKAGKIIRYVFPLNSVDALRDLATGSSRSQKESRFDGMRTKITAAYELMQAGVKVVLAPGREKDFILRAVAGEENFGTTFLPR